MSPVGSATVNSCLSTTSPSKLSFLKLDILLTVALTEMIWFVDILFNCAVKRAVSESMIVGSKSSGLSINSTDVFLLITISSLRNFLLIVKYVIFKRLFFS